MPTLWRKRQRLQQHEIKTETDMDTAALIVAAILGICAAVMLMLFFTMLWLS